MIQIKAVPTEDFPETLNEHLSQMKNMPCIGVTIAINEKGVHICEHTTQIHIIKSKIEFNEIITRLVSFE